MIGFIKDRIKAHQNPFEMCEVSHMYREKYDELTLRGKLRNGKEVEFFSRDGHWSMPAELDAEQRVGMIRSLQTATQHAIDHIHTRDGVNISDSERACYQRTLTMLKDAETNMLITAKGLAESQKKERTDTPEMSV